MTVTTTEGSLREKMLINGSQLNSANPSQVSCGSQEALTRIGAFTGAGLDATSLFCSPAACE